LILFWPVTGLAGWPSSSAPAGRRSTRGCAAGAGGLAGLADRSSPAASHAAATSPETIAAIVAARHAHHAGSVWLAALLGIAASTVGAVITRAGRTVGRLQQHLVAAPGETGVT